MEERWAVSPAVGPLKRLLACVPAGPNAAATVDMRWQAAPNPQCSSQLKHASPLTALWDPGRGVSPSLSSLRAATEPRRIRRRGSHANPTNACLGLWF
jgi:hypothetical protein